MNEWRGSDLDGLSDNDAITRLECEFPRWQCFRGTDWLCYARSHDDPDKIVRGEDWTDLRDELIRVVWRQPK